MSSTHTSNTKHRYKVYSNVKTIPANIIAPAVQPVPNKNNIPTETEQQKKLYAHVTPRIQTLKNNSVNDIWSFIPKDFRNFLKIQGSYTQVNYKTTHLGNIAFKLNNQKIIFPTPELMLKNMGLKPKLIPYISTRLKQGVFINKAVLCPPHKSGAIGCKSSDTLFIINKFSIKTMRASVSASPDIFKYVPVKVNTYYLPKSSSHSLTNRINYNSLISYSFNNPDNRSYYLSLGDEASDNNNLLAGQVYINSNNAATNINAGNISLTKQLKTRQIQFGYFSGLNFSDLSGNFSSSFNGSGFIAKISNSTVLKKHNHSQALNPIIVFLSATSKIEVYRGQQLISVQTLGIGNNQLDTRSFPSGIYPVTLKIYQSGILVKTLQKTVYKPFDTTHYNNAGYNYSFSAGVVNNQPLQFGSYDLPYLQGSIQHLLGKHTRITASGYAVSSLLVPDLDLAFYLPWNTRLDLNTAIDNGGGFQNMLNLSVQPAPWWLTTFYLNKTKQSNKLKLSSFTYSGTNYQLSQTFTLNRYGEFTLDWERDQDGTYSTGLNYTNTLYQSHGFTIQLTISLARQETWEENNNNGDTSINGTETLAKSYINRSILFTVTYNFSSGQNNIQFTAIHQAGNPDYAGNSWTGLWHHTIRNSVLQSIDTIYRSGSGLDNTSSIDSNVTLNSQQVSGNVEFTHNFSSKHIPASDEIDGGIRGSIITTSAGTALSSNTNPNDSGVLFHLHAPKGSTLLLHSDSEQMKVSPGNTFMPLAAYQTHHVYVTSDPNNITSMQFNQNNSKRLTLYPGNIIPITLNAWQTAEIYGQVDTHKQAASNARIVSNIDTTYTNNAGLFMLSIKKSSPYVTVILENHHICHIKLPENLFKKPLPAYWVGSVECQ